MSEPERPRQFEPVNQTDALRLFREGVESLASASVWTANQEISFTTHLHEMNPLECTFYTWQPSDLDPAEFDEAIRISGEGVCRFSISLASANIFFKAEYIGRDDTGLKFKIPAGVFKVQRRKDLRLPIPDGQVLMFVFRDPLNHRETLTKKALDISASGAAFVVALDEQALYPPGIILEKFSFMLRGRTITCNAEVMHNMRLAQDVNPLGVKVGVLFQNLVTEAAETVAAHIAEETRKYFSKFL